MPGSGSAPTVPARPAGKRRRRWILPVAAAILVALLAAMATIWSQVTTGPSASELATVTDSSPDRIDIAASVIRVDAASGEMTLRLFVVPRGSLSDEGGFSPAADLEILTSAAMETDPSFPAGKRIPTVDVPVALDGTGITAYPFDLHETRLEFTARQGGKTVPVAVTLTNRDALFAVGADASKEESTATLDLEITRSGSTLTFAIFMIAAMWALAIAVAIATWYLSTRRKGLVWPALGWMAATLFAVVGFRNAAPGGPPIGSLLDYLAFFWAELIIAICVCTVVGVGIRTEISAEEG